MYGDFAYAVRQHEVMCILEILFQKRTFMFCHYDAM